MCSQSQTAIVRGRHALAPRLFFVWAWLGCWVELEGATITWTNRNGGAWGIANNWNPNQVPGVDDTALITNDGSYTVTVSADARVSGLVVGGINGTQTLAVVGATLSLTNGSTIQSNGVLSLGNSTLVGSMTVRGMLNCSGSSLGNGAAVTIASNGVMNIGGNGTSFFYGVLTNAGTVNWTGTVGLQLYNNSGSTSLTGGIVNQPGAFFNVQNNQSIGGSGSPYFNNFGILQKSAGTNTTTISVLFTNTGQLIVSSGTVALAGGGSSTGTIADAGSVSVPGGNFTLSGAVPNLVLSGGTFNGVGATIGNLTLSSGTLQGTNTVTGLANWTGGSLGNSGSVTVASNAVFTIGANSTLFMYGVLTNAGTVKWTGTSPLQVYNNPAGASQTGGIVNQPGALFEVDNNQAINANGPAYFSNLGTFKKSGGTNTTTLNLLFNNLGEVTVLSGTVAFGGGGGNSGTITGAGKVSVPSGTFTMSGAVPNLVLSGGTLNSGGATIGNLTWSSGTLQGASTVTGQASWTAGTIGNSTTLTVASNGVLTLGGSSSLFFYGVLTNEGTVNWIGTATLQVNNTPGASQTGGIVNQPGALFHVQNNQAMNGNGAPFFTNRGTFRKSIGTNTTTIYLPFINTGEVNVASGTVTFAAGGINTGTITGAGNINLPGGKFSVKGDIPNVVLSGGTLNGFGATIGNLTWSGGTLQGTNTLTGMASWSGGSMDNSSIVTVASNAVLNITGSGTVYLYGVLTNAGTVNWMGTTTVQLNNNNSGGVSQTGGIVNQPGALFDVQNDRAMNGNGSPYFNNFGIFRKSAGTNTTAINLPFNNAGILIFNIYGPARFGKVSFSGRATLAGELKLDFNHGYSPTVGDSFTLLAYSSATGAFSSVNLLPTTPAWETNILTYGPTSFTLTIGSFYRLAFLPGTPGTNVAGSSIPPMVVQVQNSNGTPLATNGVPVTLALSSGGGTLSGTTTRQTDPTGKATFNDLSVDLAGSKIITASSPPWVTPVSSPLVIVSGPAAQLRLIASTASLQKQGYTLSPAPTIRVLDAFGNIVSNSTTLITASSSSTGSGTLTGTIGVNANGTNGSATFGNLHYTLSNPGQAESVVLYFNSPGLVGATHPSITVTFVPGMLTLTNGNSLVQIDPNSKKGVFAWIVDGTSQLFQHWFWLRFATGPQVSLDQLGTPQGTSSTATNAIFSYLPQGLAVSLSFTLQGGTPGSRTSTLSEIISLQNTNVNPLTLHLYDYVDLSLGGTDEGDGVSFPTNNVVLQEGSGVTATHSAQGPTPSFWGAGWYPLILNTIDSTNPAVLSNTILPDAPGDQTFAFQWDLTLGAGQTLVLNLSNNIRAPSMGLSIAWSGSNVLLFWPTNSAENLKLQSTTSLGAASAWTNVLVSPITVGADFHVTLPPAGKAQFFRLH